MANVLIISPTPFAPSTAGNRERIAKIVSMLESLGHTVFFAHVLRETGDAQAMQAKLGSRFFTLPYTHPKPRLRAVRKILRRVGFDGAYRTRIDAWYDPTIEPEIRRIIQDNKIETVFVEYAYLSKVLGIIDDTIVKVIDTHDVFSDRHRRFLDQGLQPEWLSCAPADEARALNRADFVIAIQDTEAAYFRTITNATVVTVGHVVEPIITTNNSVQPPDTRAETILFVGSANAINVASIRWFIDKVYPLVWSQRQAPLIVCGSVCNALENTPHVQLLGPVETLDEHYRSAGVVINPAQFGTGLKIKSIEALSNGCPLVSTSIGIEGLQPDPQAFCVADDPQLFAEHIVDVLANPQRQAQLSAAAKDYLNAYNRACMDGLRSIFREG